MKSGIGNLISETLYHRSHPKKPFLKLEFSMLSHVLRNTWKTQ